MLTIRNWLIDYYIVEFEQNGKDRVEYDKALLKTVSIKLEHVNGLDERSLRRFRQFYLSYPQLADPIRETLSPILELHQNIIFENFDERKALLQKKPNIMASSLAFCGTGYLTIEKQIIDT